MGFFLSDRGARWLLRLWPRQTSSQLSDLFSVTAVGAPGSIRPALTAPEAVNPSSQICAVHLPAPGCRRCAKPRSFRTFSGS